MGGPSIGAAAQAGYRVVGLDVNPPQDEQDDEVLNRFKSHYKMLETDVSDEDSVRASVEDARDFLGGQITSLVNNAGIALSGMSEKPGARVASFKKFISVNLVGESASAQLHNQHVRPQDRMVLFNQIVSSKSLIRPVTAIQHNENRCSCGKLTCLGTGTR